MGRLAQEDTAEDQKEAFEWSNRKQHILFFFAYVMNYSVDCSVLLESIESEKEDVHKTLQFLTLTIFVGAPILFLQNSIGQYTRSTCLILGEMFPTFYGIGYCMLFLSHCDLATQMYYTTKLVCYNIFTICNTFPPWMKCYKYLFRDYPNCVSRKDIDKCGTHSGSNEPCYQPHSIILSAQIFKEGIVFGRVKLNRNYSHGKKIWPMSDTFFVVAFSVFNSAIVLILLIIGTRKSAKVFYTPLKAGIVICMGLLLSTGVTLVIQQGISRGWDQLSKQFTHPDLSVPGSWTSALVVMVKSLRLAEGGHIVFGSYDPVGKPDFWRFLILIAVFIGVVFASAIYYHLFLGLLIYKLSMKIDDIITVTEENIIFVLFPTFLGILPSCYFLSLVFFFALVLLNFFSMVIKVIAIEQTITKYFQLSRYFVYVRYTICIIVTALALCMEKSEIAKKFYDLQKMYGLCSVLVVAVQQIMVVVYGIQNFFDDIEYIMKIRLKMILKLVWIVTPIFCFFCAARIVTTMDLRRNMPLKVTFVTIIMTPLVIAFIVQFFQLAKRKNLIGLLRPTDLYGPPNVEDRILRVLYNTRLTVKYRRHIEVCDHECLLNANAVKTAIEEELQQIMHFQNALKFKSVNKAWEEKISLQFKKHQNYLNRNLQKYKTDTEKKFTSTIKETQQQQE